MLELFRAALDNFFWFFEYSFFQKYFLKSITKENLFSCSLIQTYN